MIVDGLLKQLQNFTSARFKSVPEEDLAFKDGIITTLANFSKACPDFQKTDILTFIVERIPVEKENDKGLQRVLLEAVAKVLVLVVYCTVFRNSTNPNPLSGTFRCFI
jgi:hypothetical protein